MRTPVTKIAREQAATARKQAATVQDATNHFNDIHIHLSDLLCADDARLVALFASHTCEVLPDPSDQVEIVVSRGLLSPYAIYLGSTPFGRT